MANSVNLITIRSDKLSGLKGRLSKANQGLAKIATKELRIYGRNAVAELQREAPVQTGKLQASIKMTLKNPDTPNVELQINAGSKDRPEVVLRSILYGSKPHEIVPKHPGGVLVFRSGAGHNAAFRKVGSKGRSGDLVFTTHVNHPGTKPNDFVTRGLNNAQPYLDKILKDIGRLTVELITE